MTPADAPPLAPEGAYEDTIIDAALRLGFLAHAQRPARTNKGPRTTIKGVAGYPDVHIVGHGAHLVLELKRRGNKPTAEQTRWLTEYKAAGVDARLVTVPEQLVAIIGELGYLAQQGRHR